MHRFIIQQDWTAFILQEIGGTENILYKKNKDKESLLYWKKITVLIVEYNYFYSNIHD